MNIRDLERVTELIDERKALVKSLSNVCDVGLFVLGSLRLDGPDYQSAVISTGLSDFDLTSLKGALEVHLRKKLASLESELRDIGVTV